jgi:hypothetical protein
LASGTIGGVRSCVPESMGCPIVFVSCVTAEPHDMRIGARK